MNELQFFNKMHQ